MITHKRDFLAKWNAGVLGNRLRVFNNLAELQQSNYRGKIGIRSRRPDNRNTLYHIPFENLGYNIRELIFNGFMTLEEMYFGESAPDEHLILQGEFLDNFDRYLMIDRQKTQMKKVKWNQYSEQYQGLQSEMILRGSMNENSWEDFQELRDRYPGHIIEFTVYGVCLGHLPHRNTIFWETRLY